ncbi:MAG: preprotein translocase subunit SecG [Lentisphaeria bacterium]|nr:preprotein translocase subunit SecG [Lentisphaeria bacterium]
MDVLHYILIGLELVIAVLLILIILMQRSKAGGGLGGLASSGGAMEDSLGSGAGNVLGKATAFLITVFFINTILIGIVSSIKNTQRDTGLLDAELTTEQVEPATETGMGAVTNETEPTAVTAEETPAASATTETAQ